MIAKRLQPVSSRTAKKQPRAAEPASPAVTGTEKPARTLRTLSRLQPLTGRAAEKRKRELVAIRANRASKAAEDSAGHALPANRHASKQRSPLPVQQQSPDIDVLSASDSDMAGQYAFVETPPPDDESYQEWFRRVIVRNRWMTWFTTFYLHWLALLLMAAVIVHGPEGAASLLIDAGFSLPDEPVPQLFEIVTAPSEQEATSEPEPEPMTDVAEAELVEKQLDIAPNLMKELAVDAAATASVSTSSNSQDAADAPAPAKISSAAASVPPSAVSEGSFSVWTEPSEPRAGESYKIVIQVRLPEKTQRFPVSDLQGVVIGSDGYRKPIPGSVSGYLPIENGYVRFVVPIVSADVNVRDTVMIRSRMLKETQKLVLQF